MALKNYAAGNSGLDQLVSLECKLLSRILGRVCYVNLSRIVVKVWTHDFKGHGDSLWRGFPYHIVSKVFDPQTWLVTPVRGVSSVVFFILPIKKLFYQ